LVLTSGGGLSTPQGINIPTLQPVRQMHQGSGLVSRWQDCLSHGMTGLNRLSLANLEPASRRMREIVFRDEFQQLNTLFTPVQRGEIHRYDVSGISFTAHSVYSFDAAVFRVLFSLDLLLNLS
jgi:hypothetical protein